MSSRSANLLQFKQITKICNKAFKRLRDAPTRNNIIEAYNTFQQSERNTIRRFSWMDVRADMIAEQYAQAIGNCWAVALYRHYYAVMTKLGRHVQLSLSALTEEVDIKIKSSGGGIGSYEQVMKFMEKYVDKMIVHHMPDGLPINDYELLIDRLVGECPLAVGIKYFPSYFQKNFRGVLSPIEFERMTQLHEVLRGHCVLLLGKGIDVTTGEEYWDCYDSHGFNHGEGGFIRLARGQRLINCAVELKVAGNTRREHTRLY